MSSWKTTFCGAVGIIAGCVVAADFGPLVTKIFACVASIASGLGLLFARDNGVTSEQAGAASVPRSVPVNVIKGSFGLLLVGLCAFGLFSGCKTPYKAAGVVVVTVDRAADAWADYVVWESSRPGHDAARLARQENEVRAATLQYQAAMDAVYLARKAAGQAGPGAGVLAAADAASGDLVKLIASFLPGDRLAKLESP